VILGRTPAVGYVVVERGIEPDVTAVAAPVTSDGRVVAAMSLVVPSYRVTPADAERHGRALAAAAGRVSESLGRRSPAAGAGVAP